jgi:hypothetical protein
MGLRDVFRRWTKGEDERAIEREREEELAGASPAQRARDAEDFEARKDDVDAARALHEPSDALDELQ